MKKRRNDGIEERSAKKDEGMRLRRRVALDGTESGYQPGLRPEKMIGINPVHARVDRIIATDRKLPISMRKTIPECRGKKSNAISGARCDVLSTVKKVVVVIDGVCKRVGRIQR